MSRIQRNQFVALVANRGMGVWPMSQKRARSGAPSAMHRAQLVVFYVLDMVLDLTTHSLFFSLSLSLSLSSLPYNV